MVSENAVMASSKHMLMLVSPFSSNIMKLDEDNFILWKSQIIPTLRGHDLEKFILSRGPMLKKNTDLEVDKSVGGNNELDYWIKQDQLLLARYASYSRSQILRLRTQLQSAKKGYMSINEFWLKMKTIANNLEVAGEFVHETDFAFYILGGLGPEFDPISENLNSRLDSISLTEVRSRLLAYENKLEEYNAAITMNIGSNHSTNIVSTGVAVSSGMSYMLGQSSNANSESSFINSVGLHMSSLGPLAFSASDSDNQNNRSIDSPLRNAKFPSNTGYHFGNNYRSYSPNSQRFVQETRGNRGYNGGYNNRGRSYFGRGRGNRPICQVCGLMGHIGAVCYYRYTQPFQQHSLMLQGPDPRGFIVGIQSGFPLNSASAMSFNPNLVQLQSQPGLQGQFGYGSQMLVGNFGSSISTQAVSPVPSMYSNALVSPGYSNALVPPGNFMPSGFHQPSAQPNNMVGNVIWPGIPHKCVGGFWGTVLTVILCKAVVSEIGLLRRVDSSMAEKSLKMHDTNSRFWEARASQGGPTSQASLSKSTSENVVPPASKNPDTLNDSTPNSSIVPSQNLITSSPISSSVLTISCCISWLCFSFSFSCYLKL
ncbi:hypothetical protein FEM48_Zijuj09G0231300 [Ziziphus jujuba var. spinosa]|uniref:Uncharacterized protein n=1 Tax=Ziziphus jujuba var. spinosa TaxID=714518 RepID=A0A978UVV2_ZIZJJ|nr:hypothetical protein FEM48_Zijuj09G0231300 [Ziziphus jujuba var. spinosa]